MWEAEAENFVTIALMVECYDYKVSSEKIGKQLATFYTCIKMKNMVG